MSDSRRNRLDQMTAAELSIRASVFSVEAVIQAAEAARPGVAPDARLQRAISKLQEARELVADVVDSVPPAAMAES